MSAEPMQFETWRTIPGFDGRYEASDLGRVRSLQFRLKRRATPYILEQYVRQQGGYASVNIVVGPHLRKTFDVHRLVLLAFVGDAPDGCEAAHLDGNPANNSLANLAWVTRSENELHKRAHGTAPQGSRNPASTLTEPLVIAMRVLYSRGMTRLEIARTLGLNPKTVWEVVTNRTWTHMKGSTR